MPIGFVGTAERNNHPPVIFQWGHSMMEEVLFVCDGNELKEREDDGEEGEEEEAQGLLRGSLLFGCLVRSRKMATTSQQ